MVFRIFYRDAVQNIQGVLSPTPALPQGGGGQPDQLPINYLEESSRELGALYRQAITDIRTSGSVSNQTNQSIQRLIASYQQNTGLNSAPELDSGVLGELTTLLQTTTTDIIQAYQRPPSGPPDEDGVRTPATPQQLQEHQERITRLESQHRFLRAVPGISSSVVLNELSSLIGQTYNTMRGEVVNHEFPDFGNDPYCGELQTRNRLHELRTEYTNLAGRSGQRNPGSVVLSRDIVTNFYLLSRVVESSIRRLNIEIANGANVNRQLQGMYAVENLSSQVLQGQSLDGIARPEIPDN